MVWLQGRLVIYANVVICITASVQPDHAQIQLPTTTAAGLTQGVETALSTAAAPFAGSNPNPIQGIWGRSKTDLERRRPGQGLGLALNTIRKQSRIKLSESIETLHHQISDNLSTPLRSASAVLSSSDFLMHGRGGSTATATAQASAAPKVKKERRPNNSGFYYGLTDDVFFPPKQNEEPRQGREGSNSSRAQNEGNAITRNSMPSQPNRIPPNPNDQNPASPPKSLTDIMGETLLELREMREDIYGLREEMQYLKEEFKLQKRYASGYTNTDDDDDVDENDTGGLRVDQYKYPIPPLQDEHQKRIERIKRQAEFEAIGNDVEKWAHKLLFEEDGEKDGWKEVKCNKMVRKKFNENGQTTCYMKWMKDPRGKHAEVNAEEAVEYPCIKVFATMDSPLEDVCEFLSQKKNMNQYNDLVIDHRDLEEISPHSKITWSQCPQILFLKSRDFVTYCHHRWRKDGTQIVVSQACNHKDVPGNDEESEDQICRAFSLRGANFISRDPTDPAKTRMAILAHAHPGGGVPHWAVKTAVNTCAPIEPFKLFARIDQRVKDYVQSRPYQPHRADFVNDTHGGRTTRPAGLAQLGYACFWEDGGGKVGLAEPVSSSMENIVAEPVTEIESKREQSNSKHIPFLNNIEQSLQPFLEL